MRRALALLVSTQLALAACDASPPMLRLSVAVAPTSPALDTLARLRLVVRRCGEERLAFARDVNPADASLDAGVLPGEPFYVWLQGWSTCESGAACVDDADAVSDGECRCESNQRLVAEGCTPWLRVPSGRQELELVLDGTSTSCPPKAPTSCDAI